MSALETNHVGTAALGCPAEQSSAVASNAPGVTISIIVPARNEEASLGACLESLTAQSGVDYELLVVDDHSTDRTREIAASFPGVKILDAGPLPAGWTGKNNAVWTGARAARGQWLLFTDADTVHLPGSLARALKEAQDNHADLLSYSPEQIAVTFWEMATLPVVFAELARQYPPSKVSDPNSPAAAANGQYILISREAYDAIGGHAAVAHDILEDVALARAVKASGRKIRFRYAADAVRTRMYRNYAQLRDGWTKNLTLLFPDASGQAAKTLLLWGFPLANLLLPFVVPTVVHHVWWFVPGAFVFSLNTARARRANFDLAMEFLAALFGMPMFAYLLLRSKRAHDTGDVPWKGRTYTGQDPKMPASPSSTMTKLSAIVVVAATLVAVAITHSHAAPKPHPAPTQVSSPLLDTLIQPGVALGPLKLGDTEDRALELFPKKYEDTQWDDPCGTTYNWVDTQNKVRGGIVSIRVKKGKVFQIESSTTRFTTAEGITALDLPEKVHQAYKDLRAYTLLTPPNPALGSRPLVFWIDKKKGIAFVLAYYPDQHQRYIYKIVVFNKQFCPEQETTGSPKWQEIKPYTVEPPVALSPE